MGCTNPKPCNEKRDPSEEASFLPSSLSAGSSKINNFKELSVEWNYSGDKKILVCCTSKYLLKCQNGKNFNTGHHTTEIFLPMYHLDKRGFKFDIATEDGAPVALENWTFKIAIGYEDKLRGVHTKVKDQLEKPMKFSDVSIDLNSYAAVFLPGGHGPLIEMYKQEALGKILQAAHKLEMPTIALCHGPNCLRAAALAGEFPYKGYKICCFPDSMDIKTPKFGYLPGQLYPENMVCKALTDLGCVIQNTKMDDTTCVDRELITGSSQLAAQKLSADTVKVLGDKYCPKMASE